MASSYQANLPPPQFPLVDKGGEVMNFTWYNYFLAQYNATAVNGAQELTLSSSPFTYTAPSGGFIVASSGKLAISRGGSPFYSVGSGSTGGSCPLVKGDKLRVSWSGSPPTVVWFGG